MSAFRKTGPLPRRVSTQVRQSQLSRHSRWLVLLALVIAPISGAIPLAAAQESTPGAKTTLPDIEDEVMCPVCGTTLELASDSKQAIDERELIRDLIAQGLTKGEIKDELVSEFGPEVIATPSTEGFDLAAWIVPGLAVLGGAAVALIGLRRWRGALSPANGGNAPREDSAGESPEDRDRLNEDLKRYGP
jgi:cytochrome c-type biogenesis protein CcmH